MVSSGEGKGHVNMCKALEDLYNSGVNVGIEQGIETKLLEQIEKKLAKLSPFTNSSRSSIDGGPILMVLTFGFCR